jgi:galactosamine-6-phosphate isomerase
MKLAVYKDYQTVSAYCAQALFDLIKEKPNAVICIASGDSPKLLCELFVQKVKSEQLDISRFVFVGLDEWLGLSPDIDGSCHNDFKKRLFDPLNIGPSQYHLFNALAEDPEKECHKMDRFVQEKGGIDLMIVGIGMNGHIGFNEPGVGFNLFSHVIQLDDTTKTVGKRYFSQPVSLEKGITLGLAHLLAARKVFLIANGIRKAEVIKNAVQGPVTNIFPASILQKHENGFVLVDEEAASLLDKSKQNQ